MEAGEFGPVNLIQENFGSYKEFDMENRFFNPKLAGGALLDIGVYSLTLARLFLKSQPHDVLSMMNPAPTGVDQTDGILLRNAEGQMVVLALTLHSKQPKRAMIPLIKPLLRLWSTHAQMLPQSRGLTTASRSKSRWVARLMLWHTCWQI